MVPFTHSPRQRCLSSAARTGSVGLDGSILVYYLYIFFLAAPSALALQGALQDFFAMVLCRVM